MIGVVAREGGDCELGVFRLDSSATHRARAATYASLAAKVEASAAGASTIVGIILSSAQADEEKNGGDEDGGPGSPCESQGILADGGGTTDRLKVVTHLDESGRHEGSSKTEEKERDGGHEAGDGGAQTPEAGDEAREEGDDGEEESEKIEDPAEAPHVEVEVTRCVATMGPDKLRG